MKRFLFLNLFQNFQNLKNFTQNLIFVSIKFHLQFPFLQSTKIYQLFCDFLFQISKFFKSIAKIINNLFPCLQLERLLSREDSLNIGIFLGFFRSIIGYFKGNLGSFSSQVTISSTIQLSNSNS
ncbi:hypothetical protein M0811_13916 [Anaeramoeba ignava]|uniref:Uncharacterized protein n=1 Tax=Anaeramoeba ignava TaxID=1746090 RepID=A0A9Q0M0D4_ANAIG|nr:hypothetical protein M0811_13916 [Anaeramoeba ignava]